MKTSPRHVVFIDYLRGIAIISVFLYHCLAPAYGTNSLPWDWLHRALTGSPSFIALLPLHFGFLGVPIFFVISGFCIHLSFKQQGQEWVSFFIRRFFRIYPAYLAALLLFLIICPQVEKGFWFQFKYHVFFIHNFDRKAFYSVNTSFWSIAIEVQLYLIYPLLLWLVGKFGWKRTLAGLATCEIILHSWDGALYPIFSSSSHIPPFVLLNVSRFVDHYLISSPLAYWFSWSLGTYTADAFLQGHPLPMGKSSMAFWCFLVIVSYFLLILAPFSFLLCALLTTKIIGKFLTRTDVLSQTPGFWLSLLRRIGLYSYSIYLLHQPMLEAMGSFLRDRYPHIWPFLIFLSCLSLSLVVMPIAGFWYRFIERPGIALGKQIIQRMAPGKKALLVGLPAPISTKEKSEN